MLLLSKTIDATPPLPQSVMDLNLIRLNPERSIKDISRIVESDPVLSAKLLGLINSPYYGMKNKITSITTACSQLGENEIFSIALLVALHNNYNFDLSPYKLSEKEFLFNTMTQMRLMNEWSKRVRPANANALRLATFLSDIGKILISHLLVQEDKVTLFHDKIATGISISQAERDIVGATTLEISAQILAHWNVDDDVVDILRYTAKNSTTPDALKHAVAMMESVHALWSHWRGNSIDIKQEAIMNFAMVDSSLYPSYEAALDSVLDNRSA
ncbi:MAG: HDOD domain-containing protein [Campylobacterota bacterium]|nr:HDOD domain-containing protein [Campylobacterota bacterium]